MKNAETSSQDQNQNQAETIESDEGEGRTNHIAALLGELERDDNDDEDEGESEGESEGEGESTKEIKLESLDDIAKNLKVDKAKIYDIKIKLKDDAGEVTLGKLKDFYQEGHDLDLERIDWGNERVAQEQELVEARRQIEVLASLLPKDSLKKESLEAAKKVIQTQIERQRSDLLKRVPEWKDEETRKSEIEEINEHLKGYGLQFSNIQDSRIAHYVRNNMMREKRIERALEKVRPKKKTGTAPSSGQDGQRRKSSGRKISPRARHIARNILNQMDD